jgi:hypothetical protein
MATAAKFVQLIAIFWAYLIQLDVDVTGNITTKLCEVWWSYRYMFLVDPKVFRFVVNGVKAIFLGVQRGWGLL